MLQTEIKWGVRIVDATFGVLLLATVSIGGFYARTIANHETRIAVLEVKAPTLEAQRQLAVEQVMQAQKIAGAVKVLDEVVEQVGNIQEKQVELMLSVGQLATRLESERNP
jgi:hypothetical protein